MSVGERWMGVRQSGRFEGLNPSDAERSINASTQRSVEPKLARRNDCMRNRNWFRNIVAQSMQLSIARIPRLYQLTTRSYQVPSGNLFFGPHL